MIFFSYTGLRLSTGKIKTKEVFSGKAKTQSAPDLQSVLQKRYPSVPVLIVYLSHATKKKIIWNLKK